MALPPRRKSPGKKRCALFELLALAALWAAPGPGTAAPLPDIFSYRANDVASLRQGFARPPREAGPWVYWFWWNNVVSREEIARELEEMAAAGIAGAELRVVTFHGWGGPPIDGMDSASLKRLGHRQLQYLSGEWVDTLAFTCATTERLGLRLAINLGQGWPPGGPWITDAHRSKRLAWESREVEGPSTFEQSQLSPGGMAFAWKLSQPGETRTVEAASFQELARFVQPQDSGGVLRWEVPEGRWLVGLFSVSPGGLCDKGDGPEVDPGSREAVLFHLNFLFSRLDPKLGRYYGEGINRIQMHSFGYSPPGLPLPGWRMYAEIHLNRNVPWWPFIRQLTTWMARQQWLLQAGRPVADALAYPVQSNPDDGPFFQQGKSQPISAGDAVDGANSLTLPAVLRARAAGLYTVTNLCLLDDLKSIDEARQILQFLDAGTRLFACKSTPSDWPALRDAGAADLRQAFASAQSQGRLLDARTDGWKTTLGKIRSVQ